MSDITLPDLHNVPLYHGTKDLEAVVCEGFKTWRTWTDLDGRHAPCSGGNLGTGIYITCNWRIAAEFGHHTIRVGLAPNTRLVNAAMPPDKRVLQYLKREFGNEILTQPPWKVLPRNKKLRVHEAVALFRYHYQQTWERPDFKWLSPNPPSWRRHFARLANFRALLARYGFHGYGHPDDINGIVVIAEDRLLVQELICENHGNGLDPATHTLVEVRDHFRRTASPELRQLAQNILAKARRLASAASDTGGS